MQVMTTPARISAVFDGFPKALVPNRAFELLGRFCLDLDALGRIDSQTDEPLIDEQTLTVMLREFVGLPQADMLVRHLRELPGSSFRLANQVGPQTTEASWTELSERVVIFDTTPEAAFNQLELPAHPRNQDVVTAVRDCFPSMEEELLTPEILPSRIRALLEDEQLLDTVLRTLVRQLGWWAALVAVLLVPPATVTRLGQFRGKQRMLSENAWPLSMYLLAAAVGGWTLTVVGSCILAPAE